MNSFIKFIKITIIIVLINQSNGDDQLIGESQTLYIKLYHSFNIHNPFTSRGIVTITGKESPVIKENDLQIEEIAALKHSSLNGGYYYLKAVSVKSPEDENEIKSSKTIIKSCSLYESALSNTITINLDSNGQFLSISTVTVNPQCIPYSKNMMNTKMSYNTTVLVMSTVVSQGPDTQTYILRLEQEKAEKMRGDKVDNRSFFAKYWMYIVPIVFFLLISGASNSEPQGGGGR